MQSTVVVGAARPPGHGPASNNLPSTVTTCCCCVAGAAGEGRGGAGGTPPPRPHTTGSSSSSSSSSSLCAEAPSPGDSQPQGPFLTYLMVKRYDHVLAHWVTKLQIESPSSASKGGPGNFAGKRVPWGAGYVRRTRPRPSHARRKPKQFNQQSQQKGKGASQAWGALQWALSSPNRLSKSLISAPSKDAWLGALRKRHEIRLLQLPLEAVAWTAQFSTQVSNRQLDVIDVPLAAEFEDVARMVLSARSDSGGVGDVQGSEPGGFCLVDLYALLSNWINLRERLPHNGMSVRVESLGRDPVILHLLHKMGVSLACSSMDDMKAAMAAGAAAAVLTDIHCCRPAEMVHKSVSAGIRTFVVDSADEVKRLGKAGGCQGGSIIIKICAPSALSAPAMPEGPHRGKVLVWGADLDDIIDILDETNKYGFNIVGFSVDVSAACGLTRDNAQSALLEDLLTVKDAWDCLRSNDAGKFLRRVEVTGMGVGDAELLDVVTGMERALPRKSYGASLTLDVSQELGTHVCALVVKIVGRRNGIAGPEQLAEASDGFMYYVDDGCYGSLSRVTLGGQKVHVQPLLQQHKAEEDPVGNDAQDPCMLMLDIPMAGFRPSTVWGPTCDGLDCVSRLALLPEMRAGEHLIMKGAGLDGAVFATGFNGRDPLGRVYAMRKGFAPATSPGHR
jgi:ornithine decarboxylase